MRRHRRILLDVSLLCALLACGNLGLKPLAAKAADWMQFRGPGGLGTSSETGLPAEWSSHKNVVWSARLPGPGTSSPVIVGNRIYLTCYTGYAVDADAPGNMADLKRHLLCVERKTGKILWTKHFDPLLPEHKYVGEGSYHGYSSSTPISDGEHLYVFFGKSGVYCFDLDGKEIWHTSVGDKTHRWGSATSPVLYKNLLIVNASVESQSIVALDKMTGQDVWRVPGIVSAWNTPLLTTSAANEPELVVNVQDRMLAFNPETGKQLWSAEGIHRYVCPSVVAHDGVIYAIGGGHTALAVRSGGHGDVTKSETVWRVKKGSNVSSPVYADGLLYWANEKGGLVHCQDAKTGAFVYTQRLNPSSDLIYASPLLADGKLYYVSQHHGTYVVAVGPKFKLLAHNVFEDDSSRANASIAAADGELFMRTDERLYCIAKHGGASASLK